MLGENAKVAGIVIGGDALTNDKQYTVVLHKGFHVGGVGGGGALNEANNNSVDTFCWNSR